MNQNQEEIAGRLEGLARLVLILTAELEDAGIIDGPRLSGRLRQTGQALCYESPGVETARRALQEVAAALDDARQHRGLAGSMGTPLGHG